MVKAILGIIFKILLRLRYRIVLNQYNQIKDSDGKGVLFLPNHPALVDPFIVYTTLLNRFAPRVLIDERQSQRPGMSYICKQINALPIPDISKVGSSGKAKIQEAINEIVQSLKKGEHVLLYPAGQVFRRGREDLRGASAVHQILEAYPEVRVVLVRTHGLWGSSLSYAPTGKEPELGKVLLKILSAIFLNLLFLIPKRRVSLTFVEPADLPRGTSKQVLNQYLEDFYNAETHTHLYYHYYFIFGFKPIAKPEIEVQAVVSGIGEISNELQDQVYSQLKKMTGIQEIKPEQILNRDLNMDSLAKTDLMSWVESEFGYSVNQMDLIVTVADVLTVASGEVLAKGNVEVKVPDKKWFSKSGKNKKVSLPEGTNILEIFLKKAAENPDYAIAADENSGVKTYRDLITAMLIFKPRIEKMNGERIGIMLPASVASVIVYFSVLSAGKVPVMINWTVGSRNLRLGLESANINCVITANALVSKLKAQGASFRNIEQNFIYLEEIAKSLSLFEKLKAVFKSKLFWGSLHSNRVKEHSVILFTSGSESAPKAVPLSHQNQLTNIRDILKFVDIYENDKFIAFLPPFHSFGITITTLMAMLTGVPTVYHANPTDAARIGKMIEVYQATLIPGTPTFLSGIVRASSTEQLKTLRIAVTGAEKCSEFVYSLLEEKCPQMRVLEGYGITECSPVVSVCPYEMPVRNSIGKILPSLQYRLIDPEHKTILSQDKNEGILIVSGPSIFSGYLNYQGDSPFIEHENIRWYNTGDIVKIEENGCLIFKGRKKRFIKLGGEMISLPAIENILLESYATNNDDGPTLAVEATADENKPEIVLFTIKQLDREAVNEKIKQGGLSPLHNIRKIHVIASIPVLGTGKTDYKKLKQILAEEGAVSG